MTFYGESGASRKGNEIGAVRRCGEEGGSDGGRGLCVVSKSEYVSTFSQLNTRAGQSLRRDLQCHSSLIVVIRWNKFIVSIQR